MSRLRIVAVVVSCVGIAALASCGGGNSGERAQEEAKATAYKFGLVTGSSGLNDHAFNDMHYNGMMMAQRKYGIEFEYESPRDDTDFTAAAERLIARGCNVIVAGAGFFMIDSVEELSAKYPGVRFILDDTKAKTYRPNVSSFTYKQNEGSFLAGALAAKVSKKGKVAVFGAADVQVINDFMVGFAARARYAVPDIEVVQLYIQDRLIEGGEEKSAWGASKTAKKMAEEQYAAGVDVIFQVAGGSGMGIFLAAKEAGAWAIGVDSDQDYLVEGSVLTSMMKQVDKAMVIAIGMLLEGTLESRNYELGLAEDGVGLSPMTYTKDRIGEEILAYIRRLAEDVTGGKVAVPSAF
jgi:basic membrane protein A